MTPEQLGRDGMMKGVVEQPFRDFGIAKLLTDGEAKETELTQLGGRALTPDYAAPEQIAGAPITTAADVYALGVMLYDLLTGQLPYRLKRDSRAALEEAILKVDPTVPSRAPLTEAVAAARATTPKKLARMLDGDLDTIAVKALKKQPAQRYATANAFDEDIARFLRGDVVLAQRDSVAYRTLKFIRRHRIGLSVVGVLVLVLAGGLAATTYEARVASVERDAALQAQLRSLTQTAAARAKDSDPAGAMSIVLEVLPHPGANRSYTPEALSIFQDARAADVQIMMLAGHSDQVRTAVFSPDGRRIVTASFDHTARIWDAASGLLLAALDGHSAGLRGVAFSPDGSRIVTASYDHTSRVWDAASGRQLVVFNGHGDRLRSAAFSPDGRRVVTTSYDKTARVWDADTGRQLLQLVHADTVSAAVFSPDGRRIVTGCRDKTARVWDGADGRELAVLHGHTGALTSVVFSPDGKQIATGSDDTTVRIWDAAAYREVMLLNGHLLTIESVAFSPDGQRILTSSDDKTARTWNPATGRETMLLRGHTGPVTSAAFAPDGRRVVTTSQDNSARVWDAVMGRELMAYKGHTQVLAGADFSPDGSKIVTGSADRTARIWDTATGKQLQVLSGHTEIVLSGEFSPDGGRVVTASDDHSARIWDVASGREIQKLLGHTGQVEGAAFSPDGLRVVTCSFDKSVRIWDAATGNEVLRLNGHDAGINWVVYSPDGRLIVSASADRTARIWDASSGKQLKVLSGHSDIVATAAFSPDSQRVVTASDDKTARIWDAPSGRTLRILVGHSVNVTSATFSADGQRIVTSGQDKTARVWDAATGRQLLVIRQADPVNTAALSPDGRSIVTASFDLAAHLWDAGAPPIDDQLAWAAAAQFDSLSDTERFEFGLPASADAHRWPATASECDRTAGAPYDPERVAPGVMTEQLIADVALSACGTPTKGGAEPPRVIYQRARALLADGRRLEARAAFETALARGYRPARLDYAMLLSRPAYGMLDIAKALSLYQESWSAGAALAGYELGQLYEHGVYVDQDVLAPDETAAWAWYQKAADAGEPHALARFGEKFDQAALSQPDTAARNAQWLTAFKFYAAAAESARRQDWPDDAWARWRYRRASLARLLAHEDMMPEVARAFDQINSRYAAPSSRR